MMDKINTTTRLLELTKQHNQKMQNLANSKVHVEGIQSTIKSFETQVKAEVWSSEDYTNEVQRKAAFQLTLENNKFYNGIKDSLKDIENSIILDEYTVKSLREEMRNLRALIYLHYGSGYNQE